MTETWDISRDKQAFILRNGKVGQQTAGSMSKTLDKLAELTESPAERRPGRAAAS